MKIGTQLTAGAIAIGTIVVGNMGVIFLNSSENDTKLINLSGTVRGATQRAIKLEFANKTDTKLISQLDQLIDGLINGSEKLELSKATDPEYLAAMQEVQKQWNELKDHFGTSSEIEQAELFADSEKLFELTNAAVEISEQNGTAAIQRLKIIELFVAIFSLIVVGLIVYGSRQIASTLDKFTNNIAQSSDDIAVKVERQETVANEQAGSVSQTTSTVDLLGETSRRSAQQAEESAKSASTALSLAETGAETVEKTRVGMESLKDRVREIAEQIINLSEQTEQIAGVSELVGDLANQTNMLALNAAVEAARAGEYGKGFGVVAGEIRKLADQSRKSADKIKNLVTDVQAAMNSAVMVTDEGKKTAESSIELALGTAESFIGVKDAINNVFTNTSEISNAAKQQAVGIQEILAAVNALNLGAMDTAADMGDVKVSTVQLKKSAENLRAIV
jgi:methyl-accepting chemotaxis protein